MPLPTSPVLCPHSVGRPKHMRVMAGALEGDLFIGPKAEVTDTGPLTDSKGQTWVSAATLLESSLAARGSAERWGSAPVLGAGSDSVCPTSPKLFRNCRGETE